MSLPQILIILTTVTSLTVAATGEGNDYADTAYELHGNGEEVDAFPFFLEAAKRGHTLAQDMLGWYYYDDRWGITKNLPEAAYWWGKSAEGGFGRAMINLSRLYEEQGMLEESHKLKSMGWELGYGESEDVFHFLRTTYTAYASIHELIELIKKLHNGLSYKEYKKLFEKKIKATHASIDIENIGWLYYLFYSSRIAIINQDISSVDLLKDYLHEFTDLSAEFKRLNYSLGMTAAIFSDILTIIDPRFDSEPIIDSLMGLSDPLSKHLGPYELVFFYNSATDYYLASAQYEKAEDMLVEATIALGNRTDLTAFLDVCSRWALLYYGTSRQKNLNNLLKLLEREELQESIIYNSWSVQSLQNLQLSLLTTHTDKFEFLKVLEEGTEFFETPEPVKEGLKINSLFDRYHKQDYSLTKDIKKLETAIGLKSLFSNERNGLKTIKEWTLPIKLFLEALQNNKISKRDLSKLRKINYDGGLHEKTLSLKCEAVLVQIVALEVNDRNYWINFNRLLGQLNEEIKKRNKKVMTPYSYGISNERKNDQLKYLVFRSLYEKGVEGCTLDTSKLILDFLSLIDEGESDTLSLLKSYAKKSGNDNNRLVRHYITSLRNKDESISKFLENILNAYLEIQQKPGATQPLVVTDLEEGMPAIEAGLMPGDLILRLNGDEVISGAFLNAYIKNHKDEIINVTLERNGEEYTLPMRPKLKEGEESPRLGFMHERSNHYHSARYLLASDLIKNDVIESSSLSKRLYSILDSNEYSITDHLVNRRFEYDQITANLCSDQSIGLLRYASGNGDLYTLKILINNVGCELKISKFDEDEFVSDIKKIKDQISTEPTDLTITLGVGPKMLQAISFAEYPCKELYINDVAKYFIPQEVYDYLTHKEVKLRKYKYVPSLFSEVSRSHENQSSLKYLGLGNPAYEDVDNSESLISKLFTLRATQSEFLPNLEESENEIIHAHGMFKPTSAMITKQHASELNFRVSSFAEPQIIHIAAHGLTSSETPGGMFSSIALSQDTNGRHQSNNGYIDSFEIGQLKLSSDLVYLGACQTYQDFNSSTGTSPGIASAFINAGALGVIGTSWKIESQSAVEFSKLFFDRFALGDNSISQSLVDSKYAMIDGKYNHPFYWAPYICVASWPDSRIENATGIDFKKTIYKNGFESGFDSMFSDAIMLKDKTYLVHLIFKHDEQKAKSEVLVLSDESEEAVIGKHNLQFIKSNAAGQIICSYTNLTGKNVIGLFYPEENFFRETHILDHERPVGARHISTTSDGFVAIKTYFDYPDYGNDKSSYGELVVFNNSGEIQKTIKLNESWDPYEIKIICYKENYLVARHVVDYSKTKISAGSSVATTERIDILECDQNLNVKSIIKSIDAEGYTDFIKFGDDIILIYQGNDYSTYAYFINQDEVKLIESAPCHYNSSYTLHVGKDTYLSLNGLTSTGSSWTYYDFERAYEANVSKNLFSDDIDSTSNYMFFTSSYVYDGNEFTNIYTDEGPALNRSTEGIVFDSKSNQVNFYGYSHKSISTKYEVPIRSN